MLVQRSAFAERLKKGFDVEFSWIINWQSVSQAEVIPALTSKKKKLVMWTLPRGADRFSSGESEH